MKKEQSKLTPKQTQALPHFLTASSITAACKAAGITTQCYYNWINETEFGQVLEKEREQLRHEAISLLKNNLPLAAQALVELIKDKTNTSVRRLAARDLFDLITEHCDLVKFDERLKELEGKKI